MISEIEREVKQAELEENIQDIWGLLKRFDNRLNSVRNSLKGVQVWAVIQFFWMAWLTWKVW